MFKLMVLAWLAKMRWRLGIFRKGSEYVFLSNNVVRKPLTFRLYSEVGGKFIAPYGSLEKRRTICWIMIFNVWFRLNEGRKKTISLKDWNIRNNLVKFAGNLPFSYFKDILAQWAKFRWGLEIFRSSSKCLYLSCVEVQENLTAPFLRN